MNSDDRRLKAIEKQSELIGAGLFLTFGGPLVTGAVLLLFMLCGWLLTPSPAVEAARPCAERLAKARWNAGGSAGDRLICNSEGAIVPRPAVQTDGKGGFR